MMGIRKLSTAMAFVAGLAGLVGADATVHAEVLTVAAAHSLKGAFQDIVPMFQEEYGVTVQVVYGPSQTLRRQIEQGAPIDVFLPESFEEVRKLQQKGLTINGGPRIFAQTSLVLVMAAASPAASISFREVFPDRTIRIALVDPKTSALGEITAKALTTLNPAYRNRSHLIHAPHSEDVVNLVRAGGLRWASSTAPMRSIVAKSASLMKLRQASTRRSSSVKRWFGPAEKPPAVRRRTFSNSS